jgi:hypothetical protein
LKPRDVLGWPNSTCTTCAIEKRRHLGDEAQRRWEDVARRCRGLADAAHTSRLSQSVLHHIEERRKRRGGSSAWLTPQTLVDLAWRGGAAEKRKKMDRCTYPAVQIGGSGLTCCYCLFDKASNFCKQFFTISGFQVFNINGFHQFPQLIFVGSALSV